MKLLQEYQIAEAAEVNALPLLRAFTERACQAMALNDDLTYDIKLAIDEACTNIITHGYAGLAAGSILLTLRFVAAEDENAEVVPITAPPAQADTIFIEMIDFGHPFEPAEPPRPDFNRPLETIAIGGIGLYLIYQVMDDVDYAIDESGNCLTLTKRIG